MFGKNHLANLQPFFKMKKLQFLSIAFLLSLVSVLTAQVTTEPVFPTAGPLDSVTIIFDATQGNGALVGVAPVYMHAGVITNLSASNTDWQHVQGTWGTADNNVIMTSIGNNRWSKRYHVRNFYGVTGTETISRLAFVFRNQTGTIVGRAADGSDIFVEVYSSSSNLLTTFVTPNTTNLLKNVGDNISISAATNITADMVITDNGVQVAQVNGATSLNYNLTVSTPGDHTVRLLSTAGAQTALDSFVYVVTPSLTIQNPPAGSVDGITFPNDPNTVHLQLYAPNKQNVYVLGDFNNWSLSTNYLMKRGTDGATWWIDIPNLVSGQNYTFQYYVDGAIKVADPLSELVLDPNNDSYIPAVTYPNLPAYPSGKTTGIVSCFKVNEAPYVWQNTSFTPPAKEKLVVYELLIRDFVARHDFQTVMDSLDYLQNLGITALQLMPVNEFEGNISWGYNGSFHMAVDKYYGTKNNLKALVDECHRRGIAVILDVVYNHVCGQSPLSQLYWDAANDRPASDNPWLNSVATHPFNVCYDMNHTSYATHRWLDRVMTHWITEFKVDGFRFDLSKGFTQTNYGSNVGQWGNYDASRISNIERIIDVCKAANPAFFPILEHFADNNEEIVLANYGGMPWGNMHTNYLEAAMGYTNTNFSGISYQNRGWSVPNLVGYMESHDEERMMYKNITFGNNSQAANGYNVRTLATALRRSELATAFFLPVPGPKMIWQFGEIGYDKSIYTCSNGTVSTTGECRTDVKPILWNYLAVPERRRLYDVYSALAHLKADYPVFSTSNISLNFSGYQKSMKLNGTMNVVIVGNFNVVSGTNAPGFQHTGTWYDYFTGEALNVSDVNVALNLNAGEYHIYTDQALPVPPVFVTSTEELALSVGSMTVYPNPVENDLYMELSLINAANDVTLTLTDALGRPVSQQTLGALPAGESLQQIAVGDLSNGVYFLSLQVNGEIKTTKVVINH